MKKKLVELIIGETGLDGLGVDAIALVENPAIEENFLYFKEEKFVEPTAGESEGDFIGRCMSAIEGEFPDQDQRLAVCYSYWEGSEEEFLRENPCLPGYVAYGTKMKDGREVPNCVPDESSKKFQDEMNLDVLGYMTKNFEICPGAINTFKRLIDREVKEDLAGMIRSAALQADAVFGMEKRVLADGTATKEDLYRATVIVKDFMDLIGEIEEATVEEFPVDYMMGHLEVIGNLIPDEEFAIDTAGLSPYVDQITEDDEKKKDDLIILLQKIGHEEKDLEIFSPFELEVLKKAAELGVAEKEAFATESTRQGAQEIRDVLTPRPFIQPGQTEIRYKYRPNDKAISPTPAQRGFCKSMMFLNRYYTRAEIDQMSSAGVNSQFARKGSSSYDIFLYRGGSYCKHYWEAYRFTKPLDGSKQTIERAKAFDGPTDNVPRLTPRVNDGGQNFAHEYPSCDCGHEDNSYYFNDEQRIATGPAMIPNYEMVRKADDGSKYWVYFTEETIREIAEKFMREKRVDSTNIEHDSEDPRTSNYIYESWIIEDPEMDKAKAMGFNLPKGTWMVSMRIGDEQTWKLIKAGKIKGFSVEGFFGEMVQK